MNRVNFNGPVCAVNLATGDHSKQKIRKLSDRELLFLMALAEFRKREVEELRAFAKLRNRREAQWQRIHADDYYEYGFSYYAETKRETLAHYAGLRRQQKRDGLLKRFPGAGKAFDEALQKLSREERGR